MDLFIPELSDQSKTTPPLIRYLSIYWPCTFSIILAYIWLEEFPICATFKGFAVKMNQIKCQFEYWVGQNIIQWYLYAAWKFQKLNAFEHTFFLKSLLVQLLTKQKQNSPSELLKLYVRINTVLVINTVKYI